MGLEILAKLDARMPDWPLDSLESRPCPFCYNFRRPVLLRPDSLPAAFCGDCAIWYVCALPPESAITNVYRKYWSTVKPSDLSSKAARRLIEKARVRYGKDDVRLVRLSALLGGLKGKRILEVGCGLGSFLLGARAQGADIVGNDISPEACEFLRKQFSIPCYSQPLEECGSEIGRVDAIVLNDLVEHPVRPRLLMETAHSLLRDEGLLLLWTPNGGAAGTTLETARKWVGFRVNLEHLQYLSTESIVRLSRQQGWRVEHLETVGFPVLENIEAMPKLLRPSFLFRLYDGLGGLPVFRRMVPCAIRVRRGIRAFERELAQENPCDWLSGTYHLFAILRAVPIHEIA